MIYVEWVSRLMKSLFHIDIMNLNLKKKRPTVLLSIFVHQLYWSIQSHLIKIILQIFNCNYWFDLIHWKYHWLLLTFQIILGNYFHSMKQVEFGDVVLIKWRKFFFLENFSVSQFQKSCGYSDCANYFWIFAHIEISFYRHVSSSIFGKSFCNQKTLCVYLVAMYNTLWTEPTQTFSLEKYATVKLGLLCKWYRQITTTTICKYWIRATASV